MRAETNSHSMLLQLVPNFAVDLEGCVECEHASSGRTYCRGEETAAD